MRLPVIGQLSIDLIRDHQQIVSLDDRRDGLQVLPPHDCASRIIGIRQDQRLGSIRDARLQQFRRKAEVILCPRLQRHGLSAREGHARRIAHIARIRDQYLLSRFDRGPQRKIDRFAGADRDDDLCLRIVFDIYTVPEIAGDLPSQG